MLIRAACLFLAAFPVWAGNARVDVRFTPSSPSLSDSIRVEVAIIGADGSDLVLNPADIPPVCAAVLSSSGGGTRVTLTLNPIKPGPCRLPAFHTRCLHGGTDGCDVRSAETVIPIGTVVTGLNPDIRDKDETPVEFHSGPEKSGAPFGPGIWLVLLSSVAGVLAGNALSMWRTWRRNPAWRAQRRLEKLRASATKTLDSNPAQVYSHLTFILRDYLDNRLAIGARSCSSPELIHVLQRRSLCVGWTSQLLTEFLASCDRTKFAGIPASPPEFDNAAEKCLTLIQVLEFDIARSLLARI